MAELRSYQRNGIDAVKQSLRLGRKRVVLYAPTGAGKSVMALEIVKMVLAKGRKVAFLVNRKGLVHQFSGHLTKAGIAHGILQGENTFGVSMDVVVGTVQTASRRGLPPVDVVIIDEAHAVPGSSEYRKLIFAFNNIVWIGLTATPFSKGMRQKHVELGNEELFQDLVITTTIKSLIEEKFLVDCDIYAPSEPDLSGVKMQKNSFGEMDYSEKDLADAVDKPALIGDIVSHWMKLAPGTQTVVFATNIAHSKHIVEQFRGQFIKAEHVDCYMDDEEKAAIHKRFESGEITVLSNVAMLREGWDVPGCSTMILARPTKSLIAWVQMVGRVLRPADGKTRALVLDHSGSVHELGYPTEDLPLELCDGKPKKTESKKREKNPKKCPKCYFIKKTHICPQCGFAPEKVSDVVEEDGELQTVKKASKPMKQEFYSELLGYAASKGYKHGWAANKYREKFSVWPKGLEEIRKIPSQETKNWILHSQIRYAKRRDQSHAA